MGNTLAQQPSQIIVEDADPLMRDYKKASVKDYHVAKDNFDTLQATVGDKMTVTPDEFDEIFSLICQDPSEHFALFDCWALGKVDVMEVFAVVIVYCKASIEAKIPLLFDLFDFDHSEEISQYELVLLMLCTTRGLCKVIGLDRPNTEDLEELAASAFVAIDRDHSGAISLPEFADWALKEPSLVLYLQRFASTRLIFDNQREYDALLQQLCSSFVQFAIQGESPRQLACSAGTCTEVIKRHCPNTTALEADYLVRAMLETMKRRSGAGVTKDAAPEREGEGDVAGLPQMVAMDVFCMVSASYAAFVVADEDKQHVLDLRELLVLLWLLRGKEPTPQIVESFMRSLDRDQNGVLSALEWVTYAVESDTRTGSLSFATQVQLLFTAADRNGDAMLSPPELCAGLKPLVLQSLVADAAGHETTQALEKQLKEHAEAIDGLVSGLANELMQALDKNQSHRIEWVEFRPQLDFLERRVREMKTYIRDFVLV